MHKVCHLQIIWIWRAWAMWKGGGLPERHSPVTEEIAIKNAYTSFIFIQLCSHQTKTVESVLVDKCIITMQNLERKYTGIGMQWQFTLRIVKCKRQLTQRTLQAGVQPCTFSEIHNSALIPLLNRNWVKCALEDRRSWPVEIPLSLQCGGFCNTTRVHNASPDKS
jgi:hypothetical protein